MPLYDVEIEEIRIYRISVLADNEDTAGNEAIAQHVDDPEAASWEHTSRYARVIEGVHDA